MKMLIPDTIDLAMDAPAGWELIPYTPGVPIPKAHRDAAALVVWGGTHADIRQLAEELPSVQWVQALSSGAEAILDAGFPAGTVLTSGRGLHDATVAEHALALILAAVRALPSGFTAQQEHRWLAELGGTQSECATGPLRTVHGAHVVIWGFGSIGTTLATHLQALGAKVTGIASSAGTRNGFPVQSAEDADDLVGTADILVMILPASESTRHALTAELIGRLPARAWVVNVGRGSTVDEDALAAALAGKSIAGAALDVFEREPLNQNSPLWDLPNVIITPHSAGGRPRNAGQLIEENLRAFERGTVLKNVASVGKRVTYAGK